MGEYGIATICGSMRFFDDMLDTAALLTMEGWLVFMPFVNTKTYKVPVAKELKVHLDDMHHEKIKRSKKIVVVGDYIGESTSNEIQFAKDWGIPVEYTHPEVAI